MFSNIRETYHAFCKQKQHRFAITVYDKKDKCFYTHHCSTPIQPEDMVTRIGTRGHIGYIGNNHIYYPPHSIVKVTWELFDLQE